MFLGAWEGRHRSLAKAVSWRIAGSIDTLMLSYLVTRRLLLATSIAGAETITKIVLYYVHERAWTIVPWGKRMRRQPMRFELRSLSAKSATFIAALMSRFRPALHPARIGAIGSLLFCLVIVLAPMHAQFKRVTVPAPASTASETAIKLATAELRGGITTAPAVPAANEPAEPALESAAPARGTETDLQATQQEALAQTARRSLLERADIKEVQQRLNELGYLSVSATGMWGPLSRKALQAFKSNHDLPEDEIWDAATERSLFGENLETEAFVGVWGVDASACSPRLNRSGFLPTVIDSGGASAGETFCNFQRKKRTARGWDVVASCSNTRDRWIANVRLMLVGEQLIWTSERGSQSYLRCQPALGVARAF
jgi:uncharacterized membrane protein